jgi:hypothetical protein
VDKASFNRAISETAFDPRALVLVACPKRISHEWRVIVARDQIIAGSQYRAESGRELAAGCPDEIVAFASSVLQQVPWRPDTIFVMDLCASEDGLRLVELNGFSCSAHYLADEPAVVKVASELATISW